MKALISNVRRHSLAEQYGIRPGEILRGVNGAELRDIIELSFAAADCSTELEIEDAAGIRRRIHVEKHPDEELGLEFAEAVFDAVHTCRNRCIFCFVDQMIPGMRRSLYVRDDDYRLSFLYGNFITLTNLSDEAFERIIKTHLSPLYVSVHATDPEMRCQLMRNPAAGQVLEKIQRLLDAGIELHTQVVCCPGYNDGSVLERTFADLYALHPGVLTVAVVPVGLTKNRGRLHPLRAFTAKEAAAVTRMVSAWQKKCRRQTGRSFIYLGDEFYLLAGAKIPSASWYDGFPQLENGIGLTRLFCDEWNLAIKKYRRCKPALPAVIPVGESAAAILQPLMDALNKEHHSAHRFLAVPNRFFGGGVNVTGLLTGGDILNTVPPGRRLILPSVVCNSDNLFLDDMSLAAFRKRYDGQVELAADADALLRLLFAYGEG